MKKSQSGTSWKLFSRVLLIVAFAALAVAIPYFGVDAGVGTDKGSAKLAQAKADKVDKVDPEAARVLKDFVDRGVFDQMSSAKQMQLQLAAGMKYEEGVLKPGLPNDVRPYLDIVGYNQVVKLTTADTVLAALANPQVNDPTLDVIGTQKTQSETAVIRGSGNTLVSAYNDSGSFGTSGGGNVFTGYSTSTDLGATWTDRGFIPPGSVGHFGDPVLARNNTTGVIYQATLTAAVNGINIWKSTDNGVTWANPTDGAPGTTSANSDKEWIVVDNFAGTGNGNVYHGYRDFGGAPGMRFTRSTDNGATFGPNPGFLIASTGQGAFPVVGADHAVYYFWLDSSGGQSLKVRKSTDQGVTFGAAVTIGTLTTTGTNGGLTIPAGFRSNAFPSCVAHPVNANLLFCTANDINVGGTDRGDIYMYQSTDGGATWGARVKVNQDSGSNVQFTPSMAIRPDGTALSIAWYDSRTDQANRKFERFATVGTISGTTVTFGPGFVISNSGGTTPVFGADSVVNSVYMGDYDQMAADNTNFYSTHVDTRLGTQDVRAAVYTAAGPGPVVALAGSSVTSLAVANNTCTPLTLTFANNGSSAASNVTATVSTTTPGVSISNATQPIGTIAAGGTATNSTPFQMSVAPNFACGTPITLDVSTSTGDNFSVNIATQGVGYQVTTLTGQTINGGTTDVGNHTDDGVTFGVPIPFNFVFNGTNFSAINLSSNGNAQFSTSNTAFTNVCPLPTGTMNNLIAPLWDDQRTDRTGGGIFTSTTGSAPNRVFNIEFRTVNFAGTGETEGPFNYEIRLYETTNAIEFVYANSTGGTGHTNGSSATVGLQKGTGANGANDVTSFSCNQPNLSNGLLVRFTPTTTCPQGMGTCSGLAPVSVGGRVTNSAGFGLSKAVVTITGPGVNQIAVTNIFGYWSVPSLPAGQPYTVACARKGYTFTPQIITPNSNLTNVNFVGN